MKQVLHTESSNRLNTSEMRNLNTTITHLLTHFIQSRTRPLWPNTLPRLARSRQFVVSPPASSGDHPGNPREMSYIPAFPTSLYTNRFVTIFYRPAQPTPN